MVFSYGTSASVAIIINVINTLIPLALAALTDYEQ